MEVGDSQLSLAFRRDDSHALGLSEDARCEDSRQYSDWAVQVRRLESPSRGLPWREVGEQGARTSGVLIFDAMGDTASWMWVHYLTD